MLTDAQHTMTKTGSNSSSSALLSQESLMGRQLLTAPHVEGYKGLGGCTHVFSLHLWEDSW